MSAIQAELQNAEEQLQTRGSELAETEASISTQTQALTDIGERVSAARREEETLRSDLVALSEEAARLAEEAASAEARVQKAREAETSTQEELQAARIEFSRIAEERTALETELDTLVARRETLSTDIGAAEEQRQTLQRQVTELADNLKQRSEELATVEQRFEDVIGTHEGTAEEGGGIVPGEYHAGPIQAFFSSSGTFRMTSAGGGRNVTGRYSVADEVLTLEDAVGPTGSASFPMRCRIEPQDNGFRLAGEEGSCSVLKGIEFERSR